MIITAGVNILYFQVKDLLTSCGGEEFIPLFAKKDLTFKEVQYMEDKDLREVDICFLRDVDKHSTRRYLSWG